jgi:hypothetical protein
MMAHRLGIATADVTGTTGVEAVTGYMNCSISDYAAEMRLNIYVSSSREANIHTAKAQLWYASATSGPWYYVQDVDVTHDAQLFQVENAPPGYYKFLLLDKDAATLDVYYQYRK